jgi:hypothetical protein
MINSSKVSSSKRDFTPRTVCAHLAITPEDPRIDHDPETAPVYVQRTFTETAPAIFANGHLATSIGHAIWAITDNEEIVHAVKETLRAGLTGNVAFDLGNGMYAVVYPAEPTSGVNRYADAPDGVYGV